VRVIDNAHLLLRGPPSPPSLRELARTFLGSGQQYTTIWCPERLPDRSIATALIRHCWLPADGTVPNAIRKRAIGERPFPTSEERLQREGAWASAAADDRTWAGCVEELKRFLARVTHVLT